MSRRKKTDKDREEARTLGLALLVLRRSRGLGLKDLSAASGASRSNPNAYETGKMVPRVDTLRHLARCLRLPLAALYETQRFIEEELFGRESEDTGNGGPPRARRPLVARKDALRLAQEAGKAVAHCLRQQRAATQRQVAGSAAIPRSALSAVERGRRLPSVEDLTRLLAALGCSEDCFSHHFGPFGEVASIQRRGAL